MSSRLVVAFASAALLSIGCSAGGVGDPSEAASTADATTETTTIAFSADWNVSTSSPLVTGRKAKIVYAPGRVAHCTGDMYGHPAWVTTAYYRTNGGAVASVQVAGAFSDPSAKPEITLGQPGDLEVWFQTTNVWGCTEWDSSYGQNYHFTVQPPANAPGWMGDAGVVVARGTCDGGPCDADRKPLDAGFAFDDWARQRATVARMDFEVWKKGVTDFDDGDLWEQLDVELHWRVGGAGDYAMTYVDFDRRVANNARYAVDLRKMDLLPGANGAPLSSRDQCPSFPLRVSEDGASVVADVDFYFTVNGIELRPAGGGTFRGSFANDRALYAVCF